MLLSLQREPRAGDICPATWSIRRAQWGSLWRFEHWFVSANWNLGSFSNESGVLEPLGQQQHVTHNIHQRLRAPVHHPLLRRPPYSSPFAVYPHPEPAELLWNELTSTKRFLKMQLSLLKAENLKIGRRCCMVPNWERMLSSSTLHHDCRKCDVWTCEHPHTILTSSEWEAQSQTWPRVRLCQGALESGSNKEEERFSQKCFFRSTVPPSDSRGVVNTLCCFSWQLSLASQANQEACSPITQHACYVSYVASMFEMPGRIFWDFSVHEMDMQERPGRQSLVNLCNTLLHFLPQTFHQEDSNIKV